jgi:hypothetical protein
MEMNKKERQLYLKSVKRLLTELGKLYDDSSDTTSSSDSEIEIRKKISRSKKIPNSNLLYITFVGMNHRGDHRFSPDDKVRLEEENDNPKDPNAVMVKVYLNGLLSQADRAKQKKWVHVAYVARKDAKWLRDANGFEKLPLSWIKNTQTTCTYSIDLGLLEQKNTIIPTKISMFDEIYWSQNTKTRSGKVFVNERGKLDKHIPLADVIKSTNLYGVVAYFDPIFSSSYTAIYNILRPEMQYTVVAAGMSNYRGKQRWHFITYCGLRVREGKSFRRIWNEWRGKYLDTTQNWNVDDVEHMTFTTIQKTTSRGNCDMICEIAD